MNHSFSLIITGGSRGLGKALASTSLKRGYKPILLARTMSDLKKAQSELEALNLGPVDIYECDLTQEAQVNQVFVKIAESSKSSPVGGLINNAATWTGGSSIEELSTADLKRALDLNFYSAFFATKALLNLREQGLCSHPLSLVNIGATASTRGGRKMFGFASGKSLLRVFSQSLARELGPEGVHVCHLILDGLLNNERTRNLNQTKADNAFMNCDSVASTILSIIEQDPSSWTFELDLRPLSETW